MRSKKTSNFNSGRAKLEKAISFFSVNATNGDKVRARKYAIAEQYAADHNWRVEWVYDPEPYELGDNEDTMPNEVLGAVLKDEGGTVLASLWGIGDPDHNYCRIVEAGLSMDAKSR
jgi:hypothetical protein